ncbi:MAG: hypothetical protein JXR56_09745, partial [Candidatus Cloacimonetes bacterium]|nr:hypothetical protein [Candidatus Cloacimonadota bacterium]
MKKGFFLLLFSVIALGTLFSIGGDTFAQAEQIEVLPYNDSGDTTTLTNTVANASNDAFYLINAVMDLTNVEISMMNSSFDTYLWIYNADMTTVLASNDDYGGTAQSWVGGLTLAANTDYYIVCEGFSSSNGNYVLDVSADQVGSIISTTAPGVISNVMPVNGAVNQTLTTTISWTFGANTENYDLYFDTVSPPVTMVVDNAVAGATGAYDPGPLNNSTTYFWRVISRNSATRTETINPVKNFTTTFGTITNYPYTQQFTIYPVPGWSTSGTQSWAAYTSAGTPAPSIYCNFWGWTEPNNSALTTGDFDATGINPSLSFDWSHSGMYLTSYPNDALRVSISTDAGANWTELLYLIGTDFDSADGALPTTPGSFVNEEISLDAYANTTFMLKFDGISGYGPNLYLDNISIIDNNNPPPPTTPIAPLDNATGVGMTGALAWNHATGASGYYLSLGTDNPPTTIANMEDVGATFTYDYSGLTAGIVYYWQVIPYNNIGQAPNCPVWSFTSFNDVPLPASIGFPANGAQAIIETPNLQWANGGQFPDGYKLNMGTNNPPSNLYDEEDLGNVTSFAITTPLQYETTYYWQIVPYNFVGDAVNCPVWSFTTNSNLNFGGDGTLYGGYYFANSTLGGNGLGYQPVFEWVDISATGATPAYSNADDGYATVDIGFTFNFFGNDYTQVSLGTNGVMMFTNPTGSTNYGMTIPNTTTPNDCIAMMAEDLHTGNIPSLSYYGLDDMGNFVFTVMMWNDYADASEYMDIQVILYPTGRIKIQYDNYVNPNGDTGSNSLYGDATIGIENADGTIGHQYALDGVGGPVLDGMALCYATTPSDLSDGGAGLFLPGNIEFNVVNVNSNSPSYQVR